MKKKIRIIIISVFIFLMVFIVFIFIKKQNVNIIYPSVVYLECKNDNTTAFGSGIVYDIKNGRQFIVTNYHIIKGYSKIYIQDQDLNKELATIVNFNEEEDIAILTIKNTLNTKKAVINYNFDLYEKEDVYVLTSIIGNNRTYIVKNASIIDLNYEVDIYNKKVETIKLNYNIENGDSGSPVIDKKGKIIGMIILKDTDKSNCGYALPIVNVLNQIKVMENEKNRINLGALMTNSTNLELIEDYNIKNIEVEGVVLLSVKKNYPLDVSGLKKGDVIVKFDNIQIKDTSSLQKQIENKKKNSEIEIEYYRDNSLNKTTIILNK